jgi:hypothetical protein
LTTNVDDQMWTVEAASAAVRGHPSAAVAITPGRGHIGPLLSAPAAMADLVLEVWADPASAVAQRAVPTRTSGRP